MGCALSLVPDTDALILRYFLPSRLLFHQKTNSVLSFFVSYDNIIAKYAKRGAHMDFQKDLLDFAGRVSSLKDSIATEEATKTSLIMPFFTLLGYDVFNPLEFVPEFVADVGIKKGEKVDYAILQNGLPVILVEAKAVNKKLGKQDSQLFRYFVTTKAKFAILTNGIQYRFYTDLDETNKMDSTPFLQVDLLNLKNSQIEELSKFQKANFDVSAVSASASLLKYKTDFKSMIAREFEEEPSDEMVRFFLQNVYSGTRTQAVVSKFRPILKQAFEEYFSEAMNTRIISALNQPTAPAQSEQPSKVDPPAAPEIPEAKPMVLTESEKAAYQKICELLSPSLDKADLVCKKAQNYIAVNYKGNTRQWICRIASNSVSKTLVLPDANKQEIRRRVSNWFELENYKPYLVSVCQRYSVEPVPYECNHVPVYTIEIRRRFPKRLPMPV